MRTKTTWLLMRLMVTQALTGNGLMKQPENVKLMSFVDINGGQLIQKTVKMFSIKASVASNGHFPTKTKVNMVK